MCGIAGIFGQSATRHEEAVRKMMDSMAHRGPDGEGLYISPSGNCVLGHRRLAILDLTEAASQPMMSFDRQWAFVYNGECYNYKELRSELRGMGENIISTGDTEIVFRYLVRKGPSILPRLNAMFAFALWCEREQMLLLARDRYGQKPLYFTYVGGLLVFASEVRALLASGLAQRRVDTNAMHGYLAYGAVQEPFTIVAGVSIVKPATYMTVGLEGQQTVNFYWTYPTHKNNTSPEKLRESFASAVERHLISDVPIGLFLSGGIDSSAVTLAAAHLSQMKVKTMSVVFPDQPNQSEQSYSAKIAALAGTDHCEIPLTGRQMVEMLPKALEAMDQPTGDAVNAYVVSYVARQAGLKAALSGLGGDELFAGYPAFGDVPKMLRIQHLPRFIRYPVSKLLEWYSPFAVLPSKLSEVLRGSANVVNSYSIRRRVFSSGQIEQLTPDLIHDRSTMPFSPKFIEELRSLVDGREIHDAIGVLEMRTYMGQMLLRDCDSMGMANSLEIRLPFLDAEFSSCALTLDSAVRTPRHCPKWYFVKAMGDWLPREIIYRPKQGFTLPFKDWMLCELKEEVLAAIFALPKICSVIKKDVVLNLWEQFCDKPERIGWFRLWSLFVLSRYLQKLKLQV